MVHNDKVLEDVNALLDYNAVKDYLFMTVINAEEHKNDLATMPHTIIGDLAIVYKIMIQTTDERFCSARVTNQLMDQYGIELIKFETKQLDLPDDNKEAVYERMISERDNIAATYKAEGSSEAKVIRNTTDKEVAIQISDAKKQAEILEAEGEQEYMKILAEAYGEEDRQDFYSFVRSLDALKNSMTGGDKTVILSADSPIAQIFNGE